MMMMENTKTERKENVYADLVSEDFKEKVAKCNKEDLIKLIQNIDSARFYYWDENQRSKHFREVMDSFNARDNYARQELYNLYGIDDEAGTYSNDFQKQARWVRIQMRIPMTRYYGMSEKDKEKLRKELDKYDPNGEEELDRIKEENEKKAWEKRDEEHFRRNKEKIEAFVKAYNEKEK